MERRYGNIIIEANQRGRRNELNKVEGKSILACKDIGRFKVELLLSDGSKLSVSGEIEPHDGIYYKIEAQNEEDKKLVSSKATNRGIHQTVFVR